MVLRISNAWAGGCIRIDDGRVIMTPPEYVRPATVADALLALRGGTALAGGTTVAGRAEGLARIVDLQDVGLTALRMEGGQVQMGAMLRLQQIVSATANLPEALRAAARREAGLNLRVAASLGGTLLACSGRSPLVTALLGLHAQVRMEPGPQQLPLDDLLTRRASLPEGTLVTDVLFQAPVGMALSSVARSPADRPIICAVVARLAGRAPSFGVALGGFGPRPIGVPDAELALAAGDVSGAAEAARMAYAQADDAWASAEYRSEVAAVLIRRLAGEVGA
jgi:CO/xanthine dehydrogenase FAD-binding subunit